MRRTVFTVALLLSLVSARTAGAAFITYEFSATIADVDVLPNHPSGPARLDQFTSLGGAVGASAFGTFTFDDSATPYGADPSRFNSNRPGGLAGFTFGTPAGLSIFYAPTATMSMVATPERWTLDYCCSPQSNVGGFGTTIFELLNSGGALRTDVPILRAFDPDILNHGSIHFGGSYAYPLDVRATITDVRPVHGTRECAPVRYRSPSGRRVTLAGDDTRSDDGRDRSRTVLEDRPESRISPQARLARAHGTVIPHAVLRRAPPSTRAAPEAATRRALWRGGWPRRTAAFGDRRGRCRRAAPVRAAQQPTRTERQ